MLQGRVQSIADTHTLLSRNRGAGVDLAELVRRQLAPYASDAAAIISGPSVTLEETASQTLAMVLHELASNAARYGALLSPHGRVEVKWTCPAGRQRHDAIDHVAGGRWPICRSFAAIQIWRQRHSRSCSARPRRFGRPCFRTDRCLLCDQVPSQDGRSATSRTIAAPSRSRALVYRASARSRNAITRSVVAASV